MLIKQSGSPWYLNNNNIISKHNQQGRQEQRQPGFMISMTTTPALNRRLTTPTMPCPKSRDTAAVGGTGDLAGLGVSDRLCQLLVTTRVSMGMGKGMDWAWGVRND